MDVGKNAVLTSRRVETIYMDCLHRHGDGEDNVMVVEGVMHTAKFHKGRVELHGQEIRDMLAELPEEFRDGWSFLNACMDKTGVLWTGLHSIVEQLVLLGLASGNVEFCFPGSEWAALAGGMPYFRVKE